MELGRVIKAIRIIQGMSQKDLGEKVGMTQPMVSMVESGGIGLSVGMFERVKVALDWDVVLNDLMEDV